jgi:hypothetical protein
MKQSKLLLPCLVCAAMMIFVACKKGDAGPTGPAGATGATGAQGPAGPAGTANVIYSAWFDTATYYLLSAGSDTIITDIDVPKLDLNILNNGEIKVYANLGTDTDPWVWPLPYNTADGGFIDVTFFLNTIEVTSNLNLQGLPLRYILIPGGTSARTYKSINWKNYAEVKAYLGLKD